MIQEQIFDVATRSIEGLFKSHDSLQSAVMSVLKFQTLLDMKVMLIIAILKDDNEEQLRYAKLVEEFVTELQSDLDGMRDARDSKEGS